MRAPRAEKKPVKLEKHNDVRIDNYFWLNDRDNEEVINYLNAENKYYDYKTSDSKEFQKSLFEEMKSSFNGIFSHFGRNWFQKLN